VLCVSKLRDCLKSCIRQLMINVKQCVDVQMTLTCCRNLSICLLGFEYQFAISSLEVIFNRQVQEELSAHH